MKRLALIGLLVTLVSACANDKLTDKGDALCDGLRPLVDKLVEAVLFDGGDKSVVATDNLASGYDAGCET